MTKIIPVICGILILLGFSSIAPAQTITNQPQSLTVNNASSATFSVGATNATAYQWIFDGTNSINGATNSSLFLGDVSSNEIGSYTVIVYGSNGSVTSAPPATLNVIPGTIVRFTFSGLLGSPGSNVDVQLFDHDKPVTVQNFIHYIQAGGYTNMFIDRAYPGFVIQGGDYGASNRTDSTPPLTGWYIPTQFTDNTNQAYPQELNNEFGTGPLIHNVYGTLAMAMGSDTNSANSAFFFNLADNSSSLDGQDFVVFGRVINGTNVLQYFNGLSAGNGGIGNAIISGNVGSLTNVPGDGDGSFLPVNYIGANAPANSNLVFVDFSFQTTPIVDTNPPTIAITNPPPDELQTNQVAVIQGTASDDVGIAAIIGALVPQPAADGTIAQSGYGITNYAVGTTNWTVTFAEYIDNYFFTPIPPGVYELRVQAQDGAGNLSAPASQPFTNTAVLINGNGAVTITAGAGSTNNPIGYPFQYGSNYTLLATPGPDEIFEGWSDGVTNYTNPSLSFTFGNGVYTATFISNSADAIAFTYPEANATLSNTLFDVTGTVDTNLLTPPVTVSVQIFTNAVSNYSVTPPQSVVTGDSDWSVSITNYLPSGAYTILAIATDSASNTSLISENFTFTANTNPPTVTITAPASNGLLYLDGPMIVSGTASANSAPVTSVTVALTPKTNSDGSFPNYGNPLSGTAAGTTNWSLNLTNISYIPPGPYTLSVTATAGASASATVTEPILVSGVSIAGNGTVTLMRGTNVLSPVIGYPMIYGVTYTLKESAPKGVKFANWTSAGFISVAPAFNIDFGGDLITATFVDIHTPGGARGLSITYPPYDGNVFTNSFLVKGTVNSGKNAPPVTLTCRISSIVTGLQAGPDYTITPTRGTWSIPVTNLPPDSYSVEAIATNSAGFGAVSAEDFNVEAFRQVMGTYNGLFLPASGNPTPTNSGFVSLNVTSTGAYAAKLCFPAFPVTITDFRFQANGDCFSPYIIFPTYPLEIVMHLDVTNGSDTITGTINGIASGRTWTSGLILYKAVSKLNASTTTRPGKYIFDLSPANWGGTNGYAALSIGANGSMVLSGGLPDGSTFSHATGVSKDGVWPFYAVPTGYRTNGMLIGWETNKAGGSSIGQIFWCKGPGLSVYHTNQISANITTAGTNYIAPAPGTYSVVFQGGALAAPLTNILAMARAGAQFKPDKTEDKLAVNLSPNGVLTGHITNPADRKVLQFKGAFFGQSQGGSGYILEKGEPTGYFTLGTNAP